MRRAQRFWQSAGLAAIAVAFCMYAGLIETFGGRDLVGDRINLGQIILYLPPLIAGHAWMAGCPTGAAGRHWALSALAGLAVFAVPALLLLFIDAVPMRDVFQHASPGLVRFMTFETEPLPLGAAFFWASGALASLAGALLALAPRAAQKALITAGAALVATSLLSDIVGQVLRQLFGGRPDRLLFSGDALRPGIGALVLAVAFGLAYVEALVGARLRRRVSARLPLRRAHRGYALNGLALAVLLLLPWALGSYLSEVLANVGLFMLMALGLNVAIGLAGLFDLGYVTNFAVGAYLMGVLTSEGPQAIGPFNFWLILPVSLVAAMFTGFLLALPVIRMRGDYLAIATLGFGEIIRLLALSDWLAPLIGGAQGVLFIPKPRAFGFALQTPQQLYYVILAACALVLFVSHRLNRSRTGRQWMAIREDETVAKAMGIDVTWVKTLAFTLSAASGGLSGAIFASKLGTIFPHSFQLLISINVLAIIIVGGMASIPGIAVGSLVLIGVPELLREFSEYRYLFYGILLILMTLYRPAGLIPVAAPRPPGAPGPDPPDMRGAPVPQNA